MLVVMSPTIFCTCGIVRIYMRSVFLMEENCMISVFGQPGSGIPTKKSEAVIRIYAQHRIRIRFYQENSDAISVKTGKIILSPRVFLISVVSAFQKSLEVSPS